jgi:hypothetical protein
MFSPANRVPISVVVSDGRLVRGPTLDDPPIILSLLRFRTTKGMHTATGDSRGEKKGPVLRSDPKGIEVMRVTRLSYIIGAAAVVLVGPAQALAQCAPSVLSAGKKPCVPAFDKNYIKKHYGPTACPGSCFGYFPTQWTPWEAACPGGSCGEVVIAGQAGVPLHMGTPVAEPGVPAAPPATTPAKPVPSLEKAPVPAPVKPTDANKASSLTIPNVTPGKS